MPRGRPTPIQTLMATVLAMTAFAANSILCRLALGPPDIDAAGFTTIRLVAGAVTLLAIARFSGRERTLQWFGLALAGGGLVYLVSPGLSAPNPPGSVMMATAGIAWGVYSLRGRSTTDPVVTTTDNFVRSVPMVLVVAAVMLKDLDLSTRGVILAVASGALASGVGYVIWYAALRGLTATRAATVQLTVPVIAALGGLAFLSEPVTLRLGIASVLILGGVGLVLVGRETAKR